MKYVATLPKAAGRVIGGCLMGKHVVLACDGGPYILVTKGDEAVFEKIDSGYGPPSVITYNAPRTLVHPDAPQTVRVGRPIEWTELAASKWQDATTLQFDLTK